jgi:hypothetical protein
MHKIYTDYLEKYAKKICEKYAESALKYAKYAKSMGKCDMQRICTKICKICK